MKVTERISTAIGYLAQRPGKLFLIDASGAMLTAVVLFFVLRNLNAYIGMPEFILIGLFIYAASLSLYSYACLFFLNRNWVAFIRIIAFANVFYCILTIGALVFYYNQITPIGFAYVLLETIIISILVYVECCVVIQLKRKAKALSVVA